jgi:5-methylcytosine-specific restriction enzyme subunit McrC
MSKPLTLFEHETKSFAWKDSDLALLERMRKASGADVLRATTRNGKRAIQAAQHVGVVRLGNKSIQILPKIYQSYETASEEVKTKEATANLLRLLAYTGELAIREHEIAPLLRQTDDWFEILTHLFASHLREEWQRGAHRTYQLREDRLPVLKGKWRIAEQLRRLDQSNVFAVEFDEFTSDNRLNRIFRFVVERLWKLTRDYYNRQFLGELRQWLEEVTLLPNVIAADASSSQLTRLNERYRPLLNLAQLFLDGGSLKLSAGELSTFTFVFDMNQLFEKFTAEFIRRHSSQILSEELRACEFLPQTRGASLYLAKRDDAKVFHTRPDIAFRKADQFRLLIDTKYKRLEARNRNLGVSQSDFYQMHAYAHRYACNRVMLLYPQTTGAKEPPRIPFRLEACEHTVEVGVINLCINLGNRIERQNLIAQFKALFSQE